MKRKLIRRPLPKTNKSKIYHSGTHSNFAPSAASSSQHPIREFMLEAVKEMRESKSEHAGKTDPLVGAILVNDYGAVSGRAHRGKYGSGDHGEFTLLEKSGVKVTPNSVLYVTLEPCTKRGPTKVACADRVIQSGLKHVVIGIRDPNPEIYGKGEDKLRRAGLRVDFFDQDIAEQITIENQSFIDDQYARAKQIREGELKSPERTENLPIHQASTSDLSIDAINLYLNKTGKRFKVPSRELWEEFKKAGFLVEGSSSKELHPTIAGTILFGSEPHKFIPSAQIKADQFPTGGDEPRLIEKATAQTDITGALYQQIEKVLDFFQRGVRRVPRVSGSTREEVTEYPGQVIREAVVNALVHRSYQVAAHTFFTMFRDQIIISSPGLPMPPLSIEMFPDQVVSVQRNPRIAQAASVLGLMDARGYGVRNMPDRMREHGLGDPRFTAEKGFFSVILYGRELTPFNVRANRRLLAELSPRQLEIVELVEAKKVLKSDDVVKAIKISKETASLDLRRLLELKVLSKTGKGRSTTYFLLKE